MRFCLFLFLLPITIGFAFYYFASATGLLIYACQIIGAAFTVQSITYLQHWGLTEARTPELAEYGFSWEDACWMQACVTLNHAYHGRHHLAPSRRYYELSALPDGLRLPASYPVMLLVAFSPRWFDTLMMRHLNIWKRHDDRRALAHAADCIGLTRRVRSTRIRDTSKVGSRNH